MDWLGTSDYGFAREVVVRGVAAVYLIAFATTLEQFPALLGERGLLPVPRFLRLVNARRLPSVFRWRYSDRMLRMMCVIGMAVALAVVAGVVQLAPSWALMIAFLLLWASYLSIVTVGQTFYGFGWESLLLEAGFTAAWFGATDAATPWPLVFLTRWLVFRLEFGAGMIKMRGDRSWRDLTALYYHHETQPMPGPLSRQAHLLPKWAHRAEALGNHVAQLVVPFFLFAPQPVASVAGAIVVLTQLWLVATGNFAWLNWLTIVLAFSAFSDPVVHAVIPAWPAHAAPEETPIWFGVVVLLVAALLVWLSRKPLLNLFSRRQLMNASFNRWQLVNAYGAFGSVTKTRYEIVVEGTESDTPGPEARWLEYGFRGKPGDPKRVPRQFAPYHLRLDWLMWFLALGSPDTGWFDALLRRLLEADRRTLRLLALDPFDGRRPTWVRATVWRYRFATRREKRETGNVWVRESLGVTVAPRRLGGK